jgi:hypothetical protein
MILLYDTTFIPNNKAYIFLKKSSKVKSDQIFRKDYQQLEYHMYII